MFKHFSANYFIVIIIASLSGWYAHKWFVYLATDSAKDYAKDYANSAALSQVSFGNSQFNSSPLNGSGFHSADETKKVKGNSGTTDATVHLNIQSHIEHALANGNSRELIDYFEQLNSANEADWRFALVYFKQQLSNFLQNDQPRPVIDFGTAFTTHHHDDAEISQLVAEAYLKADEPLQAIKAFYATKQQIDEASELERVSTQIHQLVYQYHSQLEQQQLWSDLLSLYEYLVGAEPEYSQYYFSQAKLFIQLKDYSNASHALAYIVNDPQLGSEATKLMDYVDRALTGEVRIPITQQGSSYLVPVRLNRAFDLTLLIDTGASISAISAAKFRAISGEARPIFVEIQQISTANGVIKAPLYRFKQLALGNQIAEDVSFIVIDNFKEADGLLGMNVLAQFNFQINQEDQVLLLNQREF